MGRDSNTRPHPSHLPTRRRADSGAERHISPDVSRARNYDIAGFRPDAKRVSDFDAEGFLRALDHNVVTMDSGGRFRMPRSAVDEVIFYEHPPKTVPRPITLWIEPIITIGAVARLYLDYGWPRECLGMQSVKWEFDVTAFEPGAPTKRAHRRGSQGNKQRIRQISGLSRTVLRRRRT